MLFHSLVVAATYLAGLKGSPQYSVNTPHIYITRLDGVYEEQHQRLGIASRQSRVDHLHMRVGYIDANGSRVFL